jgi:hypothetical protein
MAEAWEEERNSTGIVVFMDESFCHLRHSRWQSVVDSNAPNQIVKPRKTGERASIPSGGENGQLVIIVHAFTKDGWMTEKDDDGKPHRMATDHRRAGVTFFPSTELVYAVGQPPTGDYHTSLNGNSFYNWAQLRLLPAMWRLYPNKRMYLVLDNCRVHATRPPGFVPANTQQKKAVLAKVLRDNGVTEVMAENGSYACRSYAANFLAPKKDGGCTKADLLRSVKQLYKDKPELCFTQLQLLLRRGVSNACANAAAAMC